MLSEEKISHLTHILLNGLINKGLITLKEDDSLVRREIKRTLIKELKFGEDIDASVRKKIGSLSKKVIEGSPEWDVLYKKFFEEEELKRGRR